jgi:hypothetical protein
MCSLPGEPLLGPLDVAPAGSHVYDADYYGAASSDAAQQSGAAAGDGSAVSIDRSALMSLVSMVASVHATPIVAAKPLTATQSVTAIKVEVPFSWHVNSDKPESKEPTVCKVSESAWKAACAGTGINPAAPVFLRRVLCNAKSTTTKHDVAVRVTGYDTKNPAAQMVAVRRATDGLPYAVKIMAGQTHEFAAPGDEVYSNASDPSIVELHGDLDMGAQIEALKPITDHSGKLMSHTLLDSTSPLGKLCLSKAAELSDYSNGGFMYMPTADADAAPTMMMVNYAKIKALAEVHKRTRQDVITMTCLTDLKFTLVRPDVAQADITKFSAVSAAGMSTAIAKSHDDTLQRASVTLTLLVVESAKDVAAAAK